jgi:hypothetical protein
MGELERADAAEGRGDAAVLKLDGKREKDAQEGAALQFGGQAMANAGSFQANSDETAESISSECGALRVITDDGALSKMDTTPRAQPPGMNTLLGEEEIPSPLCGCNSSICTCRKLELLALRSQMATSTRPTTQAT